MWRVKRSVSTGSGSEYENDTSLECLNNSLKISAAGKNAMTKRSPITKRPRSKPGMPKDYVFVDLSPIKSESADSDASSSISSPNTDFSPHGVRSESPMSQASDLFFMCSLEDELSQCALPTYNHHFDMFNDSTFGLGLMTTGYGYEQAQMFDAFGAGLGAPFPDSVPPHHSSGHKSSYLAPAQAKPSHKRTKSVSSLPSRKSAGGLQFKTYNGPGGVRKPTERRLRRTQSQPTQEILSCLSQMATQDAHTAYGAHETGKNDFVPTAQNEQTFNTQNVLAPTTGHSNTQDYLDLLMSPLQETTAQNTTTTGHQNDFEAFMHMPKADLDHGNLTHELVDELPGLDALDQLLQPINLDFFPSVPEKCYKDDFDFSSFVAI